MRRLLHTLLFPLAAPLPTILPSSAEPTCQTFTPDPVLPGPFRVATKPWDHTRRPGGEIQVTKVYDCAHEAGAKHSSLERCPIDETYPIVLELKPYIYVVGSGEYISAIPSEGSTHATVRTDANSTQKTKSGISEGRGIDAIFDLVESTVGRKDLEEISFGNLVYYNFSLPSHARKIDVGRTAYYAFAPFQSCFSGVLTGCTGELARLNMEKISVCGYPFEEGYGRDKPIGQRRYQGWINQVDVETKGDTQKELDLTKAVDFRWGQLDDYHNIDSLGSHLGDL